MRSEWKVFGLVSGFLFLCAVVYGWWTWANSAIHRPEWIGIVALILSGLLCLMCASFFWLVSRRIDPRPEDRPDSEIADGAGEVGFFSPSSYWPFGIGLASATAAVGLAYGMWWLVAAAIAGVLFTSSGLLFEYYTGSRRSAE
jgi:Cytochrome c oxidase subunit IV